QQSGTTLTQLAAQKGVAKDELVASIAADLKANAPQDAPALSATQLTTFATSIADGTRPDRAQANLSSLAAALGTDASTLLERLRSGEDLSSVLAGGASGYGSSLAASDLRGLAVDRYA